MMSDEQHGGSDIGAKIVERGPEEPDGTTRLQTRPGIDDVEGLTREEMEDRRNKAANFGMYLFLAGLTMLFLAGMILYVIRRLQAQDIQFSVPLGLWFSTGIIVISGVAAWWMSISLKQNQIAAFRKGLIATFLLGLAFVIIQIPSLFAMLDVAATENRLDQAVYRLAVFLIVLHALHVLGGMIFLLVAVIKAVRGSFKSSAEFSWIRQLTMYWHYVDAIWMVMFGLFVLMG